MAKTAAEQLKKVQRVSAGIKTLFHIGIAFGGVGVAVLLIAIMLSPSIDLSIGNGEFKANSSFDKSTEHAGKVLVTLSPQQRSWGLFLNPDTASPQDNAPLVMQSTPLLRGGLVVMLLLNWSVLLNLLQQLAKLFEDYARGEIFTLAVVNRVRKVGFALLGFPAMALLNSMVGMGLVSTIAPTLNWFDVSVNFDTLLAALVVIMISWIMDVGRMLREENELTI